MAGMEIEFSEETLRHMRDVFLLVEPQELDQLSESERHRLKQLTDKFDHIQRCCIKIRDFHKINSNDVNTNRAYHYVPRFDKLLKDCVLTHQWPLILKILVSSCKEPLNTQETLWKLGFNCFMQCQRYDLLENFAKHLPSLKRISFYDIVLNELLCLLSTGNTGSAKELHQEFLNFKAKATSKYAPGKRLDEVKLLFKAYQGLLLYLDWKVAMESNEQATEQKSFMEDMFSLSQLEDPSKDLAKSASDLLSSVLDCSGVWDMFITRLVEIHEYYDEHEQVMDVLKRYREKNPNNPNAHLYLHRFCERNGHSELSLACLQDIIKLDPCNPLVPTLFHHLEKRDPGAVCLLFNYLDFVHCKDDNIVWEILADRLHQFEHEKSSDQTLQVVRQCWESRKDWWPKTILHCQETDMTFDNSNLQYNKRTVHEFCANLDIKNKRKIDISEKDDPSDSTRSPKIMKIT